MGTHRDKTVEDDVQMKINFGPSLNWDVLSSRTLIGSLIKPILLYAEVNPGAV